MTTNLTSPNLVLASLDTEQKAKAIALTLKFVALGIGGMLESVITGPVVESYNFKIPSSVPLAKIMGKAEDMALAVGQSSALITRNKNLISVQLPRADRQVVDFTDCLWKLFPQLIKAKLPLLLGRNSLGDYSWLDLAEEPHALVAGSTGSGKSMFLLSSLCTLAVIKSPKDLKLIIVDSKQIDLAVTYGIPHIHTICRSALELHTSLDFLHNEMRRRNSLLSGVARNIDEYNTIQSVNNQPNLPRICLIIDEFADLLEEDLLQAKAKIEPFISLPRLGERLRYLAQLCRASGIHIIAATQRPSVKITTGDLKVNLPCRISFKLPSIFDSRTVLRESGAEYLLGQGDMLVQSVNSSELLRSHAPFVDIDTLTRIIMDAEGVRDTLLKVALI